MDKKILVTRSSLPDFEEYCEERFMSNNTRKTKAEQKDELAKLPPEVRARRETYDWIQSLMASLIVCVCFFAFFVRVIDVSGNSMNPTLKNGDKMLVSDVMYDPQAGDVVVFKSNTYDPNKALVKRIIAHDVEHHTITIHSLNPLYPDRTLNLADVRQIFSVVESRIQRYR